MQQIKSNGNDIIKKDMDHEQISYDDITIGFSVFTCFGYVPYCSIPYDNHTNNHIKTILGQTFQSKVYIVNLYVHNAKCFLLIILQTFIFCFGFSFIILFLSFITQSW